MVVDSDNLTVDSWRLIRGACFNPVVKLKIAMSHSCLCSSMFGHFLYPNFKRSIPAKKLIFQLQVPLQTLEQSPSTKWIFKQQGYHSKHENRPSMYEPLASPRQQPLPKQLENRKPFRGHGRFCWPCPPRTPQRSAAPPRRRGRSMPPHAAPCCLRRRGCDAEG